MASAKKGKPFRNRKRILLTSKSPLEMNHLAISMVLGMVTLVAPVSVSCCTCEIIGDGSPRSVMRRAKAVFIGEVLEVRPATTAEREDGSNSYIATVRVERFWKGVKDRKVSVETDMVGCGTNLEVGEKYLVYGIGKRLNTSSCSRTRKLKYAGQDLLVLGRGKEFKSK